MQMVTEQAEEQQKVNHQSL